MAVLWRVTLEQVFLSQIFNNVFYFEDPSNAKTRAQVASELSTNMLPVIKPAQSTSLQYTNWILDDVFDVGNGGARLPVIPTTFGGLTATSTFLPCCLLLALRCGVQNRSYFGRYYVGGVNSGNITGQGRWNSGYLTIGTNMATGMLGRYGGANPPSGLKWSVYSKKFNNWMNVNEVLVRDIPAVQRRRNVGVGT